MESSLNSSFLKSNLSLDVTKPSVKAQLTLYDILIPSLGAFIILLNFLVVLSSGLILKKGQQPRSTYLFLGNVAMTDLITGVAVIFGQVFPRENRDASICSLQIGMIVASTLASIYSVGLIAIDRFLYILYGMQYQQWVYPSRARLLILGTWIIGCIIGFLPLFGWRGNTENGRICWFILLAPRALIVLTVAVGIVPLIIVIVLYSILLYRVVKRTNRIRRNLRNGNDGNQSGAKNLRMFRGGGGGPTNKIHQDLSKNPQEIGDLDLPQTAESSTNKEKKKSFFAGIFRKNPSESVKGPSKWKAIMVVFLTTISFVIAWCPFFIASLIYAYQCEQINTKRCKSLRIVIASPLAILGFTNSLINPIIYAWWHKGFRTYVQKRFSVVVEKARRASHIFGNAVSTTTYNLSSTFAQQNGQNSNSQNYSSQNHNSNGQNDSRKMSNISARRESNVTVPQEFNVVEEENTTTSQKTGTSQSRTEDSEVQK